MRIKDIPRNGFVAKHHVKLKFLIVGFWNTIFGYLVFIGFDSLFTPLFSKPYAAYMSAAVLSNILAIINAYIFHKYITFKSEIKGIGVLFEFFRFSTTYLITFCLSLVLLPFFVEITHMTPKIAAAFVILCCTVISYLGHSRFSFRSKSFK
jgi:putative flippase GtrA